MPALLTNQVKLRWVYAISLLFMLLNAYLVTKDLYWGFLIPVVVLLILLYVYSLDKILYLVTFTTPLAVIYSDPDLGVSISLPTEPLMFGMLLVFALREMLMHDFDRKVWRHPLSLAVIFNMVWIAVTTLTSEMPLVSVKALLARLWFVIPFYFIASQLFREKRNIHRFVWLYIIPLIIVVVYTTYQHSLVGFDEEIGHWVMDPFYNDHTAYGAVLAMFTGLAFGLSFNRKYTRTGRLFSFLAFLFLALGLYLSFSRAAWLSVAASVAILLLIVLKIRFSTVMVLLSGLVVLFVMFQNQIFMKLEKNKQDSSSNLVEHVQSISNISSDASNLERINRWRSAFRMFDERPLVGWGPGTYQFMYAPFQNSQERTIISTNAGDKGNAHSEYIGPLAESGVLGSISFLLVAVLVIFTGIRQFQRLADDEARLISLLVVFSLTTYLIHGFLNNFLDSDKASVPFWGFAAILLAFDLYYPKKGDAAEDQAL